MCASRAEAAFCRGKPKRTHKRTFEVHRKFEVQRKLHKGKFRGTSEVRSTKDEDVRYGRDVRGTEDKSLRARRKNAPKRKRNSQERQRRKQFRAGSLRSCLSCVLRRAGAAQTLSGNFLQKIHKIKEKRLISAFECGTIIKQVGSLAQLGEHLPYKQRVGGSSPSISTNTVRIVDYAGIAQW